MLGASIIVGLLFNRRSEINLRGDLLRIETRLREDMHRMEDRLAKAIEDVSTDVKGLSDRMDKFVDRIATVERKVAGR